MGFRPTNTASSLAVLIGRVGGGTISAGSTDLSVGFSLLPGESTPVNFSSADVGRIITILGAGASGGILIAHVATYISPGHVTIDTPAVTSVDGSVANTTIFRPCNTFSANIRMDSLEYDSSLSSGQSARFVVQSKDGTYVPIVGQPVLITSTDSSVGDIEGAVFGGYISTVEASHHPGNDQVDSACQCASWDVLLQKRVMSDAVYTGHSAGYIANDLCSKMTGDCVGCDPVAGPTVLSITYSALTTYSDALDQLRDMVNGAGTDTYYWYTDPWRVVHFALQTTTTAPWGIDDTVSGGAQGCLVGVTATNTLEKYCNHGYVQASKELQDPVLETYYGDGTKREFSASQPIELLPQIWVNGVSKTVGVLNVDGAGSHQWFYTPGSSEFVQDGSEPILSRTDWVAIRYQFGQNRIEFYQNTAAVNERGSIEGGTGYYETVVQVDTAVTQSDAAAIAQSIAIRYGVVPQTIAIETYKPGLKAGQLINIKIPKIRANGNYLITSVSMTIDPNVPKWSVEAVDGSLIGDWRKALKDALNKTPAANGEVGGDSQTPLAPDVDGFTATESDNFHIAGSPYYKFSGTIATPSDTTGLAQIQVVMTDATGVQNVVWSQVGPFDASTTINWESANFPQPTSGPDLVFQPTVVPMNADFVPTISAHTVGTLTIHNGTLESVGGVTSVSISEPSGSRYLMPDASTHTIVRVAPVVATGVGVTYVTIYLTLDAGATWHWYGVFPFVPGGTPFIDLDVLVPTTGQAGVTSNNCTAYVMAGGVPGGPTPLTVLPTGGTASNTITVIINSPSSGGATAEIVNSTGATATTGNIFMGKNSLGNPYAEVFVKLTLPSPIDPNVWFYQVTVDWTDASGNEGNPGGISNPVGERIFYQFDNQPNPGIVLISPVLYINYPAQGSPYDYLQFKIYAISRSNTSEKAFTATDGTATLMACWTAGATYDRLLIGDAPGTTGAGLWFSEVPIGAMDGATSTYKLRYSYNFPILVLDGQVQNPDTEYTLTSTGFTYNDRTPDASKGEWHRIWGMKGNPITGNARHFAGTGSTDSVNYGNNNTAWNLTGDMAVGLWVKFDSSTVGTGPTGANMLSYRSSISSERMPYAIAVSGSSGNWNIVYNHDLAGTSYVSLVFTCSIPNDAWKFVAFVRDGTAQTVTLYVGDGTTLTAMGTQSYAGNPPAGGPQTATVMMLGNTANAIGSAGYAYEGAIEEHYVWNRTLSATELQLAMIGNPSPSGLVLACLMGNGPEIDISGNGATGTVTGTTLVSGH